MYILEYWDRIIEIEKQSIVSSEIFSRYPSLMVKIQYRTIGVNDNTGKKYVINWYDGTCVYFDDDNMAHMKAADFAWVGAGITNRIGPGNRNIENIPGEGNHELTPPHPLPSLWAIAYHYKNSQRCCTSGTFANVCSILKCDLLMESFKTFKVSNMNDQCEKCIQQLRKYSNNTISIIELDLGNGATTDYAYLKIFNETYCMPMIV